MPPQQDLHDSLTNDPIETVRLSQRNASERLAANPLLIPATILVAALIIGASLIIGLSIKGGWQTAGAGGAAQEVNVEDIDIEGAPYIGNADALVTLVYWSDYQCPFCKAFEVGGVPQINESIPVAMPDIIKTYVDTGKVKVVFKEFAFLGEDSVTAAEYSYAMWDIYPQQFYNWRVAMMKAQDEEHGGFGDAESIDELIETKFPQLDLAKITKRINDKKDEYMAKMQAEKQEAQSFGINGTPGFITGTKMIGGDAPFSTFKAAIDPQL